MAELQKSLVIKLHRDGAKRSRIVQEECQQLEIADFRYKKMRNEASEISPPMKMSRTTEHPPTKSFIKENSRRMSRTVSQGCEWKKDGAECKKENNQRADNMDRYKRMQCWVILKRLVVGRDGWAFKQPLDVKFLEFPDNPKVVSKPTGLKDIECKLNNCLYDRPEEFADDMRLVFSYALLYPSRSEIHRIAMKVSENFESGWKSLKKKWIREEKKVCPKVDREAAYV
ncbi:transcription factor GTE12-like [Gastrolobium bilobum]|uniref:transcription factor GTE12-like n=1 Tax=Gastrolobium bilobum TaxID=150636 RepID=UPI002AB2F80F|nr:transcription factor GTE12-like [Gastrolobium bilobum]XP_061351882.1 transcription factor GTE12-like [Gastrolobium bilobum]XP_061353643.1 transcription factor GTE12-like [Gastrolobium bilobum]